jgi:hypothetical protein
MMMVVCISSRYMTVVTAVFIPPTFTAFRHGLVSFGCCLWDYRITCGAVFVFSNGIESGRDDVII